jgi:hypothetical protein
MKTVYVLIIIAALSITMAASAMATPLIDAE